MKKKPEQTVLFIDDEYFVVDVLCHKLKEEGLTCVYAPNGQVALDMIAKGTSPDLVILDVMMPGMNGFEVLEKFKKNPETAKIPVVMFSNEKNPENIKKATDLGAHSFMEKVVTDTSDFAKNIKEAIASATA